jgi:excisionase family DNA binding protein
MKNLLTVAQTAEALNIKIATVRAWLLRRKLPRVNCGRPVRIPAEAIEQFIVAYYYIGRRHCRRQGGDDGWEQ